ncbi:bifunctional hydroxymethylpyrimidine kinase/phosphomethylpyrimidine kinase [Companilactobacillus baiquanensis]|uniref:pyridoxal kinase n=1 Tax=Companilactobacillus baiquanensis TaxID=2486005 RepID=A0ABW1UWK1_9LACO|nr:bifunctional hydroxymethylpyrimidine kinase/phosphomethylpyrimidine kinase [Companilactobacillus baiquanensis]
MEDILTIAGSDSLAGGGIQADLKTFEELNTFGVSALTSIASIINNEVILNQINSAVILQQLDSILDQLPIHFAKTGLLGDASALRIVCNKLRQYDLKLVVDPVLVFKEGSSQIEADYLEIMKDKLIPLAYVITPNLEEAKRLSGISQITTKNDLVKAAKIIQTFGCPNVVIKGGARFSDDQAIDYLRCGNIDYWFEGPKIDSQAIDGAGCTFSAVITAKLATGQSLPESVNFAKKFVRAGIKSGVKINSQLGSVWQGAYRN